MLSGEAEVPTPDAAGGAYWFIVPQPIRGEGGLSIC